jgi:vancomycin permeability regulator SanA
MKLKVNKRLKYAIFFLIAWVVLHSAYIMIDGLHNYGGKADVAVVLGNTVFADSSLSPWLKGRVDKAWELYASGKIRKIFVSGGEGEYHVPEGDGMKRYLMMKNIPATDIIVDNRGKNTYMTARDFKALNDSMHFSSAILVTSFYHITRCKFIFWKLGYKNVHGVHSDTYFPEDGFKLLREFAAFYKYLLFY